MRNTNLPSREGQPKRLVPRSYGEGLRRSAWVALYVVAAGLMAACGGGGGSDTPPAPVAVVVAGADSATLGAGQSTSLLANDTIGGVAANAATGGNVTLTVTSTLPTGVTVTNGVLAVAATAAPGTVTVSYSICEAGNASNCASASATITIPSVAIVSGKAVDAASAAGIAGVQVSVGTLSATTDANGNFSISNVPTSSRTTVNFNSTTHAEGSRVITVNTGTNDVQARLLRISAGADVSVATGGTVTVAGSPAQVTLGANALQKADGTLPTGNVRVSLTPINPAVDMSVMPGEMTTLSAGAAVPIESMGALNVMLRDSAGAALNLRAGQTSTVRIPVGTREASPPASIPLFYLDPATGRWVQEGTATLAGTGVNRYYEGTVTHFSTWNADRIMDTIRVTGCVANAAGTRVGLGRISSEGIDYSGTSSAVVDASGSFTIPIRRNSQATLTSISGSILTNTVTAGPSAVDFTMPSCLVLGESGGGLSIKLTWGLVPSDLDSHLLAPNGAHIYYGSRGGLTAAPFANLDVDDTSSYGPEVVTISKLMVGTYKYYVQNYSGQSSGLFSNSSARVELSVPSRATELYTVPTVGESTSTNIWQLFELDVDASCNVTVRRVNIFSTVAPAAPTGTATYCTRP